MKDELNRETEKMLRNYERIHKEIADIETKNKLDKDEQKRLYELSQYQTIIDKAILTVRDDSYYLVIVYKYIAGLKDAETAKYMNCSVSTVRRQAQKIISKIEAAMYGTESKR